MSEIQTPPQGTAHSGDDDQMHTLRSIVHKGVPAEINLTLPHRGVMRNMIRGIRNLMGHAEMKQPGRFSQLWLKWSLYFFELIYAYLLPGGYEGR